MNSGAGCPFHSDSDSRADMWSGIDISLTGDSLSGRFPNRYKAVSV